MDSSHPTAFPATMSWRPLGLGAGIGALLVVHALVDGLLSPVTDLAGPLGVVLGLAAAALAIMLSYRHTRADAPDPAVRTVAGTAAFGYALAVLDLARWAAGSLPGLSTTTRVAVAALVVGVLAALLTPPERLRGTD